MVISFTNAELESMTTEGLRRAWEFVQREADRIDLILAKRKSETKPSNVDVFGATVQRS